MFKIRAICQFQDEELNKTTLHIKSKMNIQHAHCNHKQLKRFSYLLEHQGLFLC
jgi:hypothetical protein